MSKYILFLLFLVLLSNSCNPIDPQDLTTATLSSPSDKSIINGNSVILTWSENKVYDTKKYAEFIVYFGIDTNPMNVATIIPLRILQNNHPLSYCPMLNLTSNTTYYWKVAITKVDGSSVSTNVWRFTTGENSNQYSLKVRKQSLFYIYVSNPAGTTIGYNQGDTVFVLSASTGEIVKSYPISQAKNLYMDNIPITYSSDGLLLAAGDIDNIILINTSAGNIQRISYPHSGLYISSITPDGSMIVSIGKADFFLKIWDVKTGIVLKTIPKVFTPPMNITTTNYAIAISPNSKKIFIGNIDGSMTIWDSTTGELLQTIATGHTKVGVNKLQSGVSSIAITPDGKKIITGGYNDTFIKIWNAETGTLIKQFEDVLIENSDLVSTSIGIMAMLVAYNPTNNQIISMNSKNIIKIWNAETGEIVQQLPSFQSSAYTSLSSSANGKMFVAFANYYYAGGVSSINGEFLIWR